MLNIISVKRERVNMREERKQKCGKKEQKKKNNKTRTNAQTFM